MTLKEQLGGKVKEYVRNHTNGASIDRAVIQSVGHYHNSNIAL